MPTNEEKDKPIRIKMVPGAQPLSTKCFRCKHAKGAHTTDDHSKGQFNFIAFTNCNQENCDCELYWDPWSPAALNANMQEMIDDRIAKAHEDDEWFDPTGKP